MTLKHVLLAGAALMFAPVTAGSALAADDTYSCNGSVCYDDQADETRSLNNQALEQAQRDSEDDDDDGTMPPHSYSRDGHGDGDVGAYSYGDRDDAYDDGDDDEDDHADDSPYDGGMNPYGDDDDD